jgi:hypothetical protein
MGDGGVKSSREKQLSCSVFMRGEKYFVGARKIFLCFSIV